MFNHKFPYYAAGKWFETFDAAVAAAKDQAKKTPVPAHVMLVLRSYEKSEPPITETTIMRPSDFPA